MFTETIMMLNTEDFIKRLEYIMDHFALSASAFADKVNVQRSSISHLLSGRNKPSLEFIMKIMDVFPELNLYWLLDGNGDFFKSSDEKKVAIEKINVTSQPIENIAIKMNNSTHEEQNNTGRKIDEIVPDHLNLDKYKDKMLEKVVLFYSDGSFAEYNPSTPK